MLPLVKLYLHWHVLIIQPFGSMMYYLPWPLIFSLFDVSFYLKLKHKVGRHQRIAETIECNARLHAPLLIFNIKGISQTLPFPNCKHVSLLKNRGIIIAFCALSIFCTVFKVATYKIQLTLQLDNCNANCQLCSIWVITVKITLITSKS